MKKTLKLLTVLVVLAGSFSCVKNDPPPSSEKEIISFEVENGTLIDFSPVVGYDDPPSYVMAIRVPFGTDCSSITPIIKISSGATIMPESGMETDFSRTVEYTVTAENGTIAIYWVAVYAGLQTTRAISTVKINSRIYDA